MNKTIEELQTELLALQDETDDEQREELLQKIHDGKVLKSLKKVMDLTGDEGLDGICLIAEDLNAIIEDKEIANILTAPSEDDGNKSIRGLKMIARLVPLIAKKHKQEFANVLSALTGKPANEILTYRVGLLIAMATKALTQDKDLLNLLKR